MDSLSSPSTVWPDACRQLGCLWKLPNVGNCRSFLGFPVADSWELHDAWCTTMWSFTSLSLRMTIVCLILINKWENWKMHLLHCSTLSIISSWPVQYSSDPLLNQPYLPLQSIFPTPLHFVFPNICLSHKSRNPKCFLPPNNFLMHLHLSQKQWITKVTKGQSKLEIGTYETRIIKHLKGQLKLWLRNYVLQQD